MGVFLKVKRKRRQSDPHTQSSQVVLDTGVGHECQLGRPNGAEAKGCLAIGNINGASTHDPSVVAKNVLMESDSSITAPEV
jgi:hypothetical protein